MSSISASSRMDFRNLEGEQSYDADTQYATSKASLRAPSARPANVGQGASWRVGQGVSLAFRLGLGCRDSWP